MKRGISKDLAIFFEELSWLGYVTPIFIEGLFYQWQKYFGKNHYDSLEDIVLKVINEHKTNKVNLVGHSMGGLKAMCYTLSKPENVSTCFTVASPFGGTRTAILGLAQFYFGIYSPSIFQLLPSSNFIKSLKLKIKQQIPKFEKDYDLNFINVWSTYDEFVSKKESSLESIIGRKLPNFDEFKVELGHASTFYCNTTLDLLNDLVDGEHPTILLHGFTLNEHFFDIYIESLDESLEKKVYSISYDYTKLLKV